MIIGLTGPMGAGKNEVVKILKKYKAVIIDADSVAHSLYVPQSPLWQALVRSFGSKILKRGGGINRKKLAAVVFSNKKKLEELNRIVHPFLKEAVVKKIEDQRQKTKDRRPIIINAALLKEIGLIDLVDEVWVVTAPKEKRLKRIISQRGLTRKEAEARMRAQRPEKEYLKIADVVIKNDQTLKKLKEKVLSIIEKRLS